MIIPSILKKIKYFLASERGGDILLCICMVLFGTLAFGIGKWSTLSKARSDAGPVIVTTAVSGLRIEPLAYYDGKKSTKTAAAILSAGTQSGGAFVASKNGTKYYPIDCAGAQRIKPENALWFDTESAAREAGYERTVTCK